MSPEQASGKTLDARSDIFSFGVVLYEMLAGQRPFKAATNLELLQQVIHAKPEPLSNDIPEPLRVLMTKALEKDPADRFLSMRELVAALRAGQGSSGQTATASAASSLRRFFAIAAAVALAGALAVWRMRSSHESATAYPLHVTRVSKLTSYPGDEREPAVSPDGSFVAFSWSGADGDNYDIYVVQAGAQQPLRPTRDPAPDSFPAWSPDGRQIAFVRRNGFVSDIIVVPPLGGPERTLHRFSRMGADLDFRQHPVLCWSPDGKWIVFSGQSSPGERYQLLALSIETGVVHAVSSSDTSSIGDSSPALSADGKSLAFVRYLAPLNGRVMIQSLGPGMAPRGPLAEVPKSELTVHSPVWLEDGRQLLFADASRIFQWERDKGTVSVYAGDGVLGGMSVGPQRPVVS
jgi:eukaryotic-like serine/threonine-protein kinase